MVNMKQQSQTGAPSVGKDDPLEQGHDDQAQHLAAEARKLQEKAAKQQLDPRRSMNIEVTRDGSYRTLFYINGTLWAEIDLYQDQFCIQDCLGHCLSHVEHVVTRIGRNPGERGDAGMERAIEITKQMIRDGRMRTPEEAKEFARTNKTSARNSNSL